MAWVLSISFLLVLAFLLRLFQLNNLGPIYNSHNTDSIILTLQSSTDRSFDYVFVGPSIAKQFVKYDTAVVNKILGKKVFGLTKGGASPFHFYNYLTIFYNQNFKTEKFILCNSQRFFTEEGYTKKNSLLYQEPFYMPFYVSADTFYNDKGKIMDGIVDFLVGNHLNVKKFKENETHIDLNLLKKVDLNNNSNLSEIDPKYGALCAKKTDTDLNYTRFYLEQFCILATQNSDQVVFLNTPTLFRNMCGFDTMLNIQLELCTKYNAEIINHNDLLESPIYFKDHLHLKWTGIKYYLENHLKQAL